MTFARSLVLWPMLLFATVSSAQTVPADAAAEEPKHEYGGGVSCRGGTLESPSQYFLGFMAYHRLWFDRDRYAVTLGGGAITNPGRYLVLMPPINGATASSGTPYFTYNAGDSFSAWDAQTTFDYMPSQFATFRAEFNWREAMFRILRGRAASPRLVVTQEDSVRQCPDGRRTYERGKPGSYSPCW